MNKKVIKAVLGSLLSKMRTNKGLSVFAKQNAKFENWFQVEVCGVLFEKTGLEIFPEKYSKEEQCSYDICVGDSHLLFELKIYTTRKSASENKKRIQNDIQKLLKAKTKGRILMIVAFPLDHSNLQWRNTLNHIAPKEIGAEISYRSFTFKDRPERGVLYLITYR